MEKDNLKYLINAIFKILGLYETMQEENYDIIVTKQNIVIHIDKTIVDIKGCIELYKDDSELSDILNRSCLATLGIKELINSDTATHKMIRSKVLDMTNNISRYLEGE